MIKVEDLHKRSESHYGRGVIAKKSVSCYSVTKSSKYFCTCRTYEQAYYVRERLKEENWNVDKLQMILDEYPVWYTALNEFYRYLSYVKTDKRHKWVINIPKPFVEQNQTHQLQYTNIEDALFERDFLVNHGWDYDLLVEIIDDRENPYYDVELPPYPERKIRNNRVIKDYVEELTTVQKLILEDNMISVEGVSEQIGISTMGVRRWFYNYNTTFQEFKDVVLSGEDPFKKFKFKGHLLQPNLEPNKPNFKGYVVHNSRSKKSPFRVQKNGRYYGVYETKSIAKRVVRELKKVNWDKSQLKQIQRKLGVAKERKHPYIYKSKSKYTVRKRVDGKFTTFGIYLDFETALVCRSLFDEYGWDTKYSEFFESYAEYLLQCEKLFKNRLIGVLKF